MADLPPNDEGATEAPAPDPSAGDPVFVEEQAHLKRVYAVLRSQAEELVRAIEQVDEQAASFKKDMAEELSVNRDEADDEIETNAAFESINRIIEDFSRVHDADVARLNDLNVLLKQPYFAKIVLRFRPDAAPKELYIGLSGASDDSYHRLVVDWRSPVAEVYYNQTDGKTSYVADGRTIEVELVLRRQFDVERDTLNAYFDTTVAIQDSLLLESLSRRRDARLRDITATIQREQNVVVRHDDVPCLSVSGIAGSGKTSVLLQRIAYLYYRQRDRLDADEVYLFSPNPVFGRYIEGVLPDLGEKNPHILTYDDFARGLGDGREPGDGYATLATLRRIDEACEHLEFEPGDFRDVAGGGLRLVKADQIARLSRQFSAVPAGPHRVTLMREKILERANSRLTQLSGQDAHHLELYALSIDEQIALLGEVADPDDEQEENRMTRRMLAARCEKAFDVVERDEWLRIDRIGMRILGVEGLSPIEWLYLKMRVTGLSNPNAKHVMIDEVQDYTAAQLAVIARYFRRAHFLLLGDPNQAIAQNTASPQEVREVFEGTCSEVQECRLMTSYRSSPQITRLFASLLPAEERGAVSSIQRADRPPLLEECADEASWRAALARAVRQARRGEGLTAVVAPWKQEARKLAEVVAEETGWEIPRLLDGGGELPASGVVLITLKLAKGLEFDRVIVPDASGRIFPAGDDLARRRLYTTISRATREVVLVCRGELTPLLRDAVRGAQG